jgi:hypothetical protein
MPPEGVNEVFIYSGAGDLRFYDEKAQRNWQGITFKRLTQTRDGSTINFSHEPDKTANDIRVSNPNIK